MRTIDRDPSWAPDGVRFVYTHYAQSPSEWKAGITQIWLRTPEAPGTLLTAGFEPTWAPIGSRIAFTRGANIFVLDLETGEEHQLTDWGSCFSPSWSPEGDFVTYVAVQNSPSVPADSAGIWIVSVDDAERRQVYRGFAAHPSWDPQGESIAFVCPLGSQAPYDEIVLIDLTTLQTVRLTVNSSEDRSPIWSRDGTQLTWEHSDPGGETVLWRMERDGSMQRPWLQDCWDPDWSPDGSTILFTSINRGTQFHVQALWRMDSNGANRTELSR